jgi:acyl-CoA thioesterase I
MMEFESMSLGYGAWRTRVQRGVTALLLALALPALVAHAAQPAPVRKVLVMGDSLSAAYGLRPEQGWVALTDKRLQAKHPGWRVANASVSGETTAGGASRIAGELARHSPAVVVIELGANDGLRGLPLAQTRANLERMVVASKESGARVLLLGMRMPPNFGPQYTQGFELIYRDLAKAHGTALLPFLLEPIATERSAFQSDNLHPVAAAQPRLRDHVWPALAPLLR